MKTCETRQYRRYILIGCGALFLNLMYVLVTVPNGIINGGVTSMSMILSRLPLTGVLPVNAWVTIVTGILLLLCGLFLGRENFIGSIFSCVCGVGGFNLFTLIVPQEFIDLLLGLATYGLVCVLMGIAFAGIQAASLNAFLRYSEQRQVRAKRQTQVGTEPETH